MSVGHSESCELLREATVSLDPSEAMDVFELGIGSERTIENNTLSCIPYWSHDATVFFVYC